MLPNANSNIAHIAYSELFTYKFISQV